MEETLLAVLAGVLIVSGGAAVVTSLVGMSVVLYRRFKASSELAAVPGESGSSE
jgi:nitrate reductase gamma subunit